MMNKGKELTIAEAENLYKCGYRLDIDNGRCRDNAPLVIKNLISGKYTSVPTKIVSIPASEALTYPYLAEQLKCIPVDKINKNAKVVIYNATKARNPLTSVFGIDVFDGVTSLKSADVCVSEIPFELLSAVYFSLKMDGPDRILYEDEIEKLGDIVGLPYDESLELFGSASILDDISLYAPFLNGSIGEIIFGHKNSLDEEYELENDCNIQLEKYAEELADDFNLQETGSKLHVHEVDDYDMFY